MYLDIPSIFYGATTTAFIESTNASIAAPATDDDAIFYIPLMKDPFSPSVVDPSKVESLNNLVIAKTSILVQTTLATSLGMALPLQGLPLSCTLFWQLPKVTTPKSKLTVVGRRC
ncbi:hypothetical protein HAX54_025671 [Datura stramonium]|uniref:Uncharacterized protein n=1 Tax=Datura stramonium TaxID=4076 RepID=A0ABS8UZT2_DATST|nr:hypothetical protein [Datura stramonium]